MTDTEKCYAQIQKEALALTWSCDKFSCYILGHHFDIETDHNPLVPLPSTKNLDNLPPRILRLESFCTLRTLYREPQSQE